MKKLFFIVTSSELGGAQVWIKDQIKLMSSEFEISLITNKKGWLSYSLSNIPCFFVPEIESRFSCVAFFKIQRLIKNENADIVVASSANAGLYTRLSRVITNFRCIYVSHGWSCLYNGGRFKAVFIFIEKVLSYVTDIILCISNNDKELALHKLKISMSKLKTIQNGIWPIEKKKSNPVGNKFKIIFVGRLQKPKRVDLLIEAVSSFNDVELTVVGNGPLLNKLPRYKNVLFLGEVPNFSDFYKYDLFSLISDSEGLPMSALEASSSQLPLLLSNVGGCSELISINRPNGITVHNNVTSIQEAIKQLKLNYSYYQLNAVDFSKTVDLSDKIDEYLKLYLGR